MRPVPSEEALDAAWYTPVQLLQMRRAEQEAAAYQRMVTHRQLFEAAVAATSQPLTPEAQRALWDQTDREAGETHGTHE